MKNSYLLFWLVLPILFLGKQLDAGCVDETVRLLRQRRAEGAYGGLSPHYFEYDLAMLRKTTTNHLLNWILADRKTRGVTEPGTAVDLGCGVGNDSIRLLRAGWKVACVDERPLVFEMIRSVIADEGIDASFNPHTADINKFEIPPADIILNIDAFPDATSEQTRAFLANVRQGLKPGGYFAVNLPIDHLDVHGALVSIEQHFPTDQFSRVHSQIFPYGSFISLELVFQKLPTSP